MLSRVIYNMIINRFDDWWNLVTELWQTRDYLGGFVWFL